MPASPLLRSGELNLQALLSSGELNLQAYNDAGNPCPRHPSTIAISASVTP